MLQFAKFFQRTPMAKKIITPPTIILDNGFTRKQARTSPALTEAQMHMNALELKAFYQTITLVDMSDDDFNDYEINVDKFAQSLNLPTTNREFLRQTCLKLAKITFCKDFSNKSFKVINIFSSFFYNHTEKTIKIRFSEDMREYLLDLKRYTKIQNVEYLKSFNSKYAIRIYTLLKDYRLLSQRDFNLDELTKMLEIPKSMTSSFTRFNQKVLEPAIREINEKSDLEIYEVEKFKNQGGKKITDIRIKFGNRHEKLRDDFVDYLIKTWTKYKDYSLFYMKPFILPSYEPLKHNIFYISHIETRQQDYFQLFIYTDKKLKERTVAIGCPIKKDFIKGIIDGIAKAIEVIYENEKKEKLSIFEWQSKKDNLEAMKKIFQRTFKNVPKDYNEAEHLQLQTKQNDKQQIKKDEQRDKTLDFIRQKRLELENRFTKRKNNSDSVE